MADLLNRWGFDSKRQLTKQQKKDWEAFKAQIVGATETFLETPEQKKTRLEQFKTDYNAFFCYYFPHYAESPCAEYHIEIASNLLENKKINQFNIIYRGGAKSVHANLGIPAWLIFVHNEIEFMLIIGVNEKKAEVLLMDIQIELEFNQRLIADFGLQMMHGNWEEGQFKIQKGTMFMALGINQSMRGLRNMQYRPDYVSVDDVEDMKKAENAEIVSERVDKITDDIGGSFSKDRQRLVISNNMIAKKGVIAGLIEKLKNKSRTKITWRNAIDASGNPTWPERYTKQYWHEEQSDKTSATWEREWMNNPVKEGKLFKAIWIHYIDISLVNPAGKPNYNKILVYGDLSYKTTGDYKALIALGKAGNKFHVLDMFVKKTSLGNVIAWCYDFRKQIPENIVVEFQMEANFIQDMFLDSFNDEGIKRGHFLNIKGDKRVKPEKFTRIEAMTTFFQSGKIEFSSSLKDNPNMEQFLDQLLLFEKGSSVPDDAPDALEGGLHILNNASKVGSFPNIFIPKTRKNSW